MSQFFLIALTIVGTALFFGLPLLALAYAVVLARLKRHQALSESLVQRSLLMLGLWLAAIITAIVAAAIQPLHGYFMAWLSDALMGSAAIAGVALLWLRPKPPILARLAWPLTIGGVCLTAFMAFSIHIAALAYDIGRYSDFNEASIQSKMAHDPNDPAPHYNQGNWDIGHADDTGAVSEFQQAVRMEKPDSSFREEEMFMLGHALVRTGHWDQAVTVYQQLATHQDSWGVTARRYLAHHFEKSSR